MPKNNQRDLLMNRKDAIYNPDRKSKPKQRQSARELKRILEKMTKKPGDK